MAHSGQGLLDHLLGTRRLLVEWGARPALCDAGLFHSVYGTEHYQPRTIPLSMRTQVQEMIGTEAEALAWLFCVMRRASLFENLNRPGDLRVQDRLTGEWLPLSREQFCDLVNLSFANTLEALPRLSWSSRRACRAFLARFRSSALPVATALAGAP